MTKVDGAHGTHSVSEEEYHAFIEHVNSILAGDAFLSDRLPIDPRSPVTNA